MNTSTWPLLWPNKEPLQIEYDLQFKALPRLERLARHPSYVEEQLERRFGRTEPRYVSSPDEDSAAVAELVFHGPAYKERSPEPEEKIKRYLPLDEAQRCFAAMRAAGANQSEGIYSPGRRYELELAIEKQRITLWVAPWNNNVSQATQAKFFVKNTMERSARAPLERLAIIARRNIRRQWQKMGVWNPEWGIPGRVSRPHPNDNAGSWRWAWQSANDASRWKGGPINEALARNPRHPITRALRARQGLRRDEHTPEFSWPPPTQDAPAFEGQTFILSRPWFMMEIEKMEDLARVNSYSWAETNKLAGCQFPRIADMYDERGECGREQWQRGLGDPVAGWKWRNESPSPEPEDLAGIDDLSTFELTPSEADALESVRPPSPPPPPVYTDYDYDPIRAGFWKRLEVPLAKPHDKPGNQRAAPDQGQERLQPPPPPSPRQSRQQPRRSLRIAAGSARRRSETTRRGTSNGRVSRPAAKPRRRTGSSRDKDGAPDDEAPTGVSTAKTAGTESRTRESTASLETTGKLGRYREEQ